MNIYLLGFMGSGKTYLGSLLAQRLNWTFLDLDEAIKQTTQKTITTLFAELGEAGFRTLEQEALIKTQHLQTTIVATGGGTPCFYNNMNFIKNNGRSVFLNPPIQVLWQRLQPEKAQRPLLQHLSDSELLDFITIRLTQRLSYYQQADFQIDSSQADALQRLLECCF